MQQAATHLAVPGLRVLPIEIGPVAVLVPPGALVRHGTVGNSNVIVSVLCGERASLVIAKGVSCKKNTCETVLFVPFSRIFGRLTYCQETCTPHVEPSPTLLSPRNLSAGSVSTLSLVLLSQAAFSSHILIP